jgi:hypothetical protein
MIKRHPPWRAREDLAQACARLRGVHALRLLDREWHLRHEHPVQRLGMDQVQNPRRHELGWIMRVGPSARPSDQDAPLRGFCQARSHIECRYTWRQVLPRAPAIQAWPLSRGFLS